MKINKLLVLISVTTLPFLAACMSPTERIAHGLSAGTLTQAEARKAFDDGAEVSAHLLKEATVKGEFEIVRLFISKGANPWEMKDTTGVFSLFDYATQGNDSYLLGLCLDVKGRCPELAEKKSTAFVESVIMALRDRSLIEENELKSVHVEENVAVNILTMERLGMSRSLEDGQQSVWQIWNSGLALETKPKMEAVQTERLERKRQVEQERQRLEKERLERERRAELERQEKERKEAAKMWESLEKKMLRRSMRNKVFLSEKKLSEEERSRAWALLEAFGEEHMPTLTDRCKEARQLFLESKVSLDELAVALRAEGINMDVNSEFLWGVVESEIFPEELNVRQKQEIRARKGDSEFFLFLRWWKKPEIQSQINDIFQAAGNRWVDLATEYWWLRYKLTDFYSQFKIGAITPDDLATKDAEFAKDKE